MSSSPFSRGPSRVIVRARDPHSSPLETRAIQRSARSQKYLFGLRDGYAIETVVIKRADGFTACVSSQVGCAFGCSFCASGRAGLIRNLSSIEIVEQVVRLEQRVNRIVFMGIGEPLNNYNNVLRAIRLLRDRDGLAIPTTGITVSTIGIPRALAQLREEHLAINLTVSLHATTQRVRACLIPGAAKHRLENVVGAALSWAQRHRRPVTFAYVLLPGLNDSPDDARRLRRMLVGRPARVNLLRWNPVEGADLQRTRERSLAIFRRELARAGIPAIVRDTQGADIDAACGQLWLRDLNGSYVARRSAPRVQNRGSRRGDRPARLRRPRRRG